MLARKIALNTIISIAARLGGTALALVTIGLATRYLSRTEWGEYSIMLTIGGIFAVLAEGGLYQLLVREISKEGADEQKIASNLFSLRLIFSLFIFVLAPLASLFFPYSDQARTGILIGMVGFWLLSGSQVLMGVFQKYLRMDKVALAEVAARAVQLGLVFVFIKMGLGFLWLVVALTLSSLVNFGLVIWFARRYIKIKLAFDFVFWWKAFWQSFPLAVSNILVMIYFFTDSLFLSIFKPAADVGIYRLSYKVLESLIFFPAMFVGLVMPLLSRSAHQDWARFKAIFQRSLDVLIIFALPLVFGTIVLSPSIIGLLGGGNYPESVPILDILIVAVGAIFLSTLFSFSLIAAEKQRSLLVISGAGAVFNVTLNLIFIPRYSYYAAAVTTLATEILVAVLMLIILARYLKFWPSFRSFVKSLVAALFMAAVLWWLRSLNLAILLVLGGMIYLAALYFMKGFSWREILELTKKEGSGRL